VHDLRLERRQVALQVDDGVEGGARIAPFDRLENPVGATRVIGAGQDRLPAGLPHRLANRLGIGSDHDRAAISLNGPAPNMHDHGLPGDVGERLVGQSRCLQSGGDNEQGFRHGGGDNTAREHPLVLGRPEALGYNNRLRFHAAGKS
jgi:hypothetical protein